MRTAIAKANAAFEYVPSLVFNLRPVRSKVAYIVASRTRAGIRGGNANNTANDGLGYLNVNNAVGNANVNISARLSEKLFCWPKPAKITQYIVHHRTVGGLITSIGISKFMAFDKGLMSVEAESSWFVSLKKERKQ